MNTNDFLSRLDGVRARGAGKWLARCPAHQDKSPSLSIAEGDTGLLIHCFALCNKPDIVAAVGLTMADLFFDGPLSRGERSLPKPAKLDRVALAWRFELAAFDRRGRGVKIVEAGKTVTVAMLTDEELDGALAYMAQAYGDLERAELFEGVADDLRARDFSERKAREQHPCAA